MKQRTQIGIFCIALVLILVIIQLINVGCAGSQALSPERQKAIKDSLKEVHRSNVYKAFSSGYEHYKQGKYERARPYLRKTAKIDTTNIYGANLYQHLGLTYLYLNMPDSAEWAYIEGKTRDPDKAYFYESLAYLYERQGRYDEAISEYESVVELAPDSAAYHSKLGQLYTLNEENEKAVASLEIAVRLNPNDKKAQEILDQLLFITGDPEKIIAQREAMVQQFPDDMKLRIDLADSYFKFSKFEKTIRELTVVISKDPDNILALEILGESYQQLEKYGDAVTAYQKILKIRPEDKKNYCNLAMAFAYQGRYQTAISQISKALSLDSRYGLAFLTKGLVYEIAAEKCVEQNDQKLTFDDKLVYKMAYDQFQRAKRDLEWKDEAERHLRFLETLIPTTQDLFFHKNQTMPRSECYNWIK